MSKNHQLLLAADSQYQLVVTRHRAEDSAHGAAGELLGHFADDPRDSLGSNVRAEGRNGSGYLVTGELPPQMPTRAGDGVEPKSDFQRN
jgi:hypothetical protein